MQECHPPRRFPVPPFQTQTRETIAQPAPKSSLLSRQPFISPTKLQPRSGLITLFARFGWAHPWGCAAAAPTAATIFTCFIAGFLISLKLIFGKCFLELGGVFFTQYTEFLAHPLTRTAHERHGFRQLFFDDGIHLGLLCFV
jgi:hypothetical protein